MIGGGVSFVEEFFAPRTPVNIPVRGFNHGQRLRMVIVPLKKHLQSKDFVVNLRSSNDILFHFNPRFKEKAVVRNSTHYGQWGAEERYTTAFPFHHDHVYTLEFIAHHREIVVKINGQPFTSFQERYPGSEINLIEISGDLHVHSVHVQQ